MEQLSEGFVFTCIRPRAQESYLAQRNLLSAALAPGCDAVRPGFGFLSENPEFARRVEEAGLVFIGPAPEVIEKMGQKSAARVASWTWRESRSAVE